MFAVPGWSLSSSDLKRQTSGDTVNNGSTARANAHNDNNESDDGHHQRMGAKKRKQRGDQLSVNEGNLAELWEKIIERKGPNDGKLGPSNRQGPGAKRAERKKKKERREKELSRLVTPKDGAEMGLEANDVPPPKPDGAQDPEKALQNNRRKKKKEDRDGRASSRQAQSEVEVQLAGPVRREVVKQVAQEARAAQEVKLTPLQASMRQKLVSARFRHLNENLYRTSSTDSFKQFQENPDMFEEYHEGFRQQVASWPENPVDGYIRELELRGRQKLQVKKMSKHKKKDAHKNSVVGGVNGTKAGQAHDLEPSQSLRPLPRNRDGICTVADLGCGDARIAQAMEPLSKGLKIQVLSYDLQAGSSTKEYSRFVTQADIANLPLRSGTVDVAIFCLALMGTNWIDFVEEAYRILRWNGELWIAEIKSRFVSPSTSSKSTAGDGAAAKKKSSKKSSAKVTGENNEDIENNKDQAFLDMNLDEDHDSPGNKGKTDLAPFIEVLRKRGFALSSSSSPPASTAHSLSNKAIDLSNKMFVKMEVIKALKPTKGRLSTTNDGASQMTGQRDSYRTGSNMNQAERKGGNEGRMPTKKRKFLDDDTHQAEDIGAGNSLEAAVLKPCLYKVR